MKYSPCVKRFYHQQALNNFQCGKDPSQPPHGAGRDALPLVKDTDSFKDTLDTPIQLFMEKNLFSKLKKANEKLKISSEALQKMCIEENNLFSKLKEANETLTISAEAIKKNLFQERQIVLALREAISTEQETLADVRRQRIDEEMRRDNVVQQRIEEEIRTANAVKIFDYVKTTIAIANAGFHQSP